MQRSTKTLTIVGIEDQVVHCIHFREVSIQATMKLNKAKYYEE